MFGEQNIIRTF